MNLKQMLKRLSIFIFVFILFCITNTQNPAMAIAPQSLYDKAWRLIYTKYVDDTQNQQNWERWRHKYDNVIKDEEDAYVAIGTMVDSLGDVYTKFLTPKEYKEESESIEGSLKGIGVQIGVRDGKLLIIAPLEDTPGEKAGLLSEDEILEINGESTKGITVEAAADKIRGPEGTSVKLLIKRKGVPNKYYTIQRANIELKSVSTKAPKIGKVDDNLGYIRLSSFISRNAASEFQNALNQLKDKDGIIIDLRSNPGGLLTNAIYTPAFLREQIGKLMRVEFLIGTNNLVDRIGILQDVGASYILLRALESDVITYADIYSIKFITISNLPYNMLLNFNNCNNTNCSNNYLNNTQIQNQEMNYRYY